MHSSSLQLYDPEHIRAPEVTEVTVPWPPVPSPTQCLCIPSATMLFPAFLKGPVRPGLNSVPHLKLLRSSSPK